MAPLRHWSHLWLTWANALTAVRALLIVPTAWCAADARWTWAALLFSLAVLSDLLDGPLARRFHQTSALGGLIDHATDATFVSLLLASLSAAGFVPWPLPLLVVAAFLQYVLDSEAHSGRALRASWLGRVNGIGYFVLAGAIVYRNALALSWPDATSVDALAWLLVASSLASMLDRLHVRRASTE
jgi:phosphatidylglycerophosphate synthase